MQFFHRRHPEIGMRLELPIKPRRSRFLCSNTQEIGIWITSVTVIVSPVAIMAVTVIAVAIVAVAMVTVMRFEWPDRKHAGLFSILHLKSKPGMSGSALHRSRSEEHTSELQSRLH